MSERNDRGGRELPEAAMTRPKDVASMSNREARHIGVASGQIIVIAGSASWRCSGSRP